MRAIDSRLKTLERIDREEAAFLENNAFDQFGQVYWQQHDDWVARALSNEDPGPPPTKRSFRNKSAPRGFMTEIECSDRIWVAAVVEAWIMSNFPCGEFPKFMPVRLYGRTRQRYVENLGSQEESANMGLLELSQLRAKGVDEFALIRLHMMDGDRLTIIEHTTDRREVYERRQRTMHI